MIIPALDIINGNAVRLYQGNYNIQFKYGDPITYLNDYINQGAQMVHLVDLVGAKDPEKKQSIFINKLIQNINPMIKVQIGGGIRHTADIEQLLKSGATRIVLGSTAIIEPKKTKIWFRHFDLDALILALDIRVYSIDDCRIMINGWKTETNVQLKEIIEEYCSIGLKRILCTDISKDGTLTGADVVLYQSICSDWPQISFQASGGISKLTQIQALRYSKISDIIIGRAFLEKKFTVAEAISCWQNA